MDKVDQWHNLSLALNYKFFYFSIRMIGFHLTIYNFLLKIY